MKNLKLSLVFSLVLLINACSSTPPKPEKASGQVRPANVQQQALDDLIEIARAAQPKRFMAERASDVKETLQAWSKTAGMTLQYKSAQTLRTTGIVDELDIRAAVMALALQFPDSDTALMVQFTEPRVVRVSDVQSSDALAQNCPKIPSGAIVIGRYCLLASPSWYVDPADKLLSDSLTRWANAAKLQLNWQSDLDWPIIVVARQGYRGDLLDALGQLKADLASAINLTYTITDGSLIVRALSKPQPIAKPGTKPGIPDSISPPSHSAKEPRS